MTVRRHHELINNSYPLTSSENSKVLNDIYQFNHHECIGSGVSHIESKQLIVWVNQDSHLRFVSKCNDEMIIGDLKKEIMSTFKELMR